MKKKILIVTALPFRVQGNQSLLRFTRMFLTRGYKVTLCSTGNDSRGENVYTDSNLTFIKIPTLSGLTTWATIFLSKKDSNNKVSPISSTTNHFSIMKSHEILPPFGYHTPKVMIRKWASFIENFLDNIFCFLYISTFLSPSVIKSTIIIGYETGNASTARWLSFIFRKIYINKYQGTILKAVDRNISDAKKYYPSIYYGTNKSDLCLMVNDGTDGEFYAKLKGCQNVRYEPHGVAVKDYINNISPPSIISENTEKFILLNNASGSRWKRPDRVMRALSKVPKESLQNILLICTYFADDREQLKEYTESLALKENVIFLDKLDHIESNALVQFSDALIMTNDMANLGNPVLEAIYYGTPIISLDDGSLDGFVRNGVDGYLIPIDSHMDDQMAKAIETLYLEKPTYNAMKENIAANVSVSSIEDMQEKEFEAILQVIGKD